MDIEILTIGRELLIGKIVNTNAQWLAEQAAAVGHRMRRMTVVDDDVAD
ncbi:MAG: molybdopterin-binding protein, partial [Candidatus Bathyarchaeia archaeon]